MNTERTACRILVVDDDVPSCRTLQLHLSSQGYEITLAHSVDDGLEQAHAVQPHIIILDIRMPGKSGLDGLPEFKQALPHAHVIMITAFHDMESTIQAMQHGADDYIHKPIDIHELDRAIKQLLAYDEQSDVIETGDGDTVSGSLSMVGCSWAMKEVFKNIGLIADSPVTVLITGESGTGKELVAQAIHRASTLANGPFVAVNCAALVETLLESDMFGHEKGAFTGATHRQPGKFELANDGTIFLDEVGELSPTMQSKLLRVLQEKEYTPVGASSPVKTNARIITATNVELTERVAKGEFREDLMYRLQVMTLHLPPLRERREDIPVLVPALLSRINRQLHRNITQISRDVIDCFQEYDWPGNVRELENVLAKAVALCSGNMLTRDSVSDICQQAAPELRDQRGITQMSLQEVEKDHVQRILETTHWHRGRTCEILGISRPRLRRLINQYGLHPENEDAPLDDEEET